MRSGKPIDIDLLNAGYRYALSLCSSHQDAEDIVQDAWLSADKCYNKLPEKLHLYRIIRNLYIDKYRYTRKTQYIVRDPIAHRPDTHTVQTRSADGILRFLSQLPDVEREALYLSVVEGYTADEISQITSTGKTTVLSLINQSKKKLRAGVAGENVSEATVIDLNAGRVCYE